MYCCSCLIRRYTYYMIVVRVRWEARARSYDGRNNTASEIWKSNYSVSGRKLDPKTFRILHRSAWSSVLSAAVYGALRPSTSVDRDRTCANPGDGLKNLALLNLRIAYSLKLSTARKSQSLDVRSVTRLHINSVFQCLVSRWLASNVTEQCKSTAAFDDILT